MNLITTTAITNPALITAIASQIAVGQCHIQQQRWQQSQPLKQQRDLKRRCRAA